MAGGLIPSLILKSMRYNLSLEGVKQLALEAGLPIDPTATVIYDHVTRSVRFDWVKTAPDRTLKAWPEHWPEYHNAVKDPCDMLVGPCACGASHEPGEFVLHEGTLYRYRKPVK